MNYEKQRRRLEKDGAEWFDTLKKIKIAYDFYNK